MRKWIELVFDTKVENAAQAMERHRVATNIKAGFVQLVANLICLLRDIQPSSPVIAGDVSGM